MRNLLSYVLGCGCWGTSALAGTGNPQTCEPGESPDIVAADLNQTVRWGNVDGVTAFSVGLALCNPGTCWLNFFFDSNQHPVVGHNMYRLKTVDGATRFEQIGMSWVQHAFFALSQSFCFTDCQPTNGQHLGVHCSDVSSASIQGQQNYLGPRSQINAFTGEFPIPFSAPPAPPTIGRRLQVHDVDLDPVLNPDALYFVESQYVAPDDAMSGNGGNNTSHRRVVIAANPSFNIFLVDATRREVEAIRAWKENGLGVGIPDPAVEERDIPVPNDGTFVLAAKATDLGTGFWHYEYAIQNLNSHRSARSFTVPVSPGTVVQNPGFHDVDYHSGEPYELTDWSVDIDADSITWSTQTFSGNENANALRWGTLYNFRFDADGPPGQESVTLGLFRPGAPAEVSATTVAPAGVPAPPAVVTAAVSRKPSMRSGSCDIALIPARASEPRKGGVTEVRVAFNVPPGAPTGPGVSLAQATCDLPEFVPYSGGSTITSTVESQELVVTLSPGLENARSYRLTLSGEVTSVAGQAVEVRCLMGDVSGDGLANATDRSEVVGVWSGSGFSCDTDLDGDGLTNAVDRSLTVAAWTGGGNCSP